MAQAADANAHGPFIEVDAAGQAQVSSHNGRVPLAPTVTQRCLLLRDLLAEHGAQRAALPDTISAKDVTTWDAYVSSGYIIPEEPTPRQLAQWLAVSVFLNDQDAFRRLGAKLAALVQEAVAQCRGKRPRPSEQPAIFEVRA